jgi:transcriptional regulator with XRE-family HTH domain
MKGRCQLKRFFFAKVIYFHYLRTIKPNDMEDINRIKVVLVEKKRTNKWLAEQMGVKPSTVSKWCTNSSQPDVASLLRIADLLEVDIKELIVREYKSYLEKVNSTIDLY